MVGSDRKLENLKSQLNKWRSSKIGQKRIPEDIWVLAVELAKQHGINPVAQRLNLNYTYLKNRVYQSYGSKEEKTLDSGNFIQIQNCSASNPMFFEIFKIDGSQMRMECVKGFGDEVGAVINAFMGN